MSMNIVNKETVAVVAPRRGRTLPLPPLPARENTGDNMQLNVNILHVDHSYQRAPNRIHIKAIAAKFDWSLLHRLTINQRPDGSYYIIDGQQRWSALIKLDGDCNVDCVVHHLETIEEEATLYRHLNFDRKCPTALDHWRAMLAEGTPDVVRIQNELDHADLKLTHGSKAPRTINAVGTLIEWIDKDIEALAIVVMILGKFEYFTDPVGAEVFKGLCATEAHLRKHSNSLTRVRADKTTHYQYLVDKGYRRVKDAAFTYLSGRGGQSSIAKKAAEGIIELLNHRLRNRLPQIESNSGE